jgi:hypothetical protein
VTTTKTSKRINLPQLDAELGGVGLVSRGGLAMSGGEKEIEAPASVTKAALDAAIAAHVAVDVDANAATVAASLTAALATIDAMQAGLDAIVAASAPGNGSLSTAVLSGVVRDQHGRLRTLATNVKTLSQNQRLLIRRALGDYSGTT